MLAKILFGTIEIQFRRFFSFCKRLVLSISSEDGPVLPETLIPIFFNLIPQDVHLVELNL